MSRLILDEPPRGPLTCDFCARFVRVADAMLSHEYGDYGSILSTEVWCPRCVARASQRSSPSGSGVVGVGEAEL